MCIGAVILRQIFRLIVLPSPISVPAFALVFKISEKNTMQRRAKTLSQDWDGMPPMYTKEQVEAVLRGKQHKKSWTLNKSVIFTNTEEGR